MQDSSYLWETTPNKSTFMRIVRHIALTVIGLFISAITLTAQVQQTVFVPKPGTLSEMMKPEEASRTTNLTLQGKLNAIDFKYLRDEFKQLTTLDLSYATISRYAGKKGTYNDRFYIYQANSIPAYAFCSQLNDSAYQGKETLLHIILPKDTKCIEESAFKGCKNLAICQIRKATPPNLQKEALNDSITAIFVPEGCGDAYRQKEQWKGFAILEGESSGRNLRIPPRGSLARELQKRNIHPQEINFLTLSGKMDENDFTFIRNNMPNLVSIDLSECNATVIPHYTFSQKKNLLKVVLPNGLKRIEQRAFSGCGRLAGTLILPPDVTAIEYGAFIGCERLQKVLATGNQLVTLGENLFGEEENKLTYK